MAGFFGVFSVMYFQSGVSLISEQGELLRFELTIQNESIKEAITNQMNNIVAPYINRLYNLHYYFFLLSIYSLVIAIFFMYNGVIIKNRQK